MRKIILLSICLANLFTAWGQKKSFGEIVTDDFEKKNFFFLKLVDSLELPASIDLSKKMPPAADQNPKGTCWAFASTYSLISYMSNTNKEDFYFYRNGKPDFSKIKSPELPIQLYFENNTDCDAGATTKDLLLKTLVEYGSISLKELQYTALCDRPISEELKNKAKLNSTSEFDVDVIHKDDLLTLKKVLSQDQPLIISIRVDTNFKKIKDNVTENFKPMWNTYDIGKGWHAMTIVGYNDSIKAVKVMNSWGEKWGNKGHLWISYDIIKKYARYYCYPVVRPKITIDTLEIVPENSKSFTFEEKTELSSWFKSGYYRKFNDLKIKLLYLNYKNEDNEYGLIELSDEKDTVVSKFYIQNNSSKEFYINDVKYSFTFNNVGRIGYNFTKKAMFFTIKQL
jgi:Papain family cysteine protease